MRDSSGFEHAASNSLPANSIVEAPPSPFEPHSELSDNSATIRTLQYPISAYSRPAVPSEYIHVGNILFFQFLLLIIG